MSGIEYAYRRFATVRFPLPTEEQVADVERRVVMELPPCYRQFLLDFNGGRFDMPEILTYDEEVKRDGLECLFGINADHPTAEITAPYLLTLFEDDPPIAMPIGSTGCAGLVVLVIEEENQGAIYLKKPFGGFCWVADSIEEFFDCLHESPDRDT